MSVPSTPLSQALESPGKHQRPTPIDAFRMARRQWLKGQRINLSALAQELGVTRVTLVRWVGNKDMLIGEILWSLYKDLFDRALENARQEAGLEGAELLVSVYHDINVRLINAEPLHNFLRRDPHVGFRVLAYDVSPLQRRLVELWRSLLDEEAAAGRIAPAMNTDDLAYFIIQLGEGTVYSDVMCGRSPALEPSNTALRLLLARHT